MNGNPVLTVISERQLGILVMVGFLFGALFGAFVMAKIASVLSKITHFLEFQ